SPRVAQICSALLGVDSVRLYHDNVLSKEPGCGRTPWHYDATHFPLETMNVVTAWIPVQPIPREMGPLTFAAPIESYKLVETLDFNTKDRSYDRAIAETLSANNIQIDDGPFALGDVSFHHNLSLHSAGANHSLRSRVVLANTYYEDGAQVVDSPTLISGDWQKFLPGVSPGEVAATALNPVCWPPSRERPTR
ncbi:MAG: phytanoyl-CoA dioxygenase family protein, partial [Myxococcota bacterium]